MEGYYIEPKERETEYQRLARLGLKLGIPIFACHLEMAVTLPGGGVIHRHKQRSHSWVRNAYNLLFSELAACGAKDATFGAGLISQKLTSGSVQGGNQTPMVISNTAGGYNWLRPLDASIAAGYYGQAGDLIGGIVVGSGTNAESFENYALQTAIAHGTGAGQLSYAASSAPSVSYDAPSKTMANAIVRFINNNSGGSVSVNEVALYGYVAALNDNVAATVCLSRDLLGATVTVPNTGQLKVTYTIQLVYPA